MLLPVLPEPLVVVARCEHKPALPMFLSIFVRALVTGSIRPLESALAVHLSMFPLSLIGTVVGEGNPSMAVGDKLLPVDVANIDPAVWVKYLARFVLLCELDLHLFALASGQVFADHRQLPFVRNRIFPLPVKLIILTIVLVVTFPIRLALVNLALVL